MGTHRCKACDGYGSNPVKSRRWYEFWKNEPCKDCDATGHMKPPAKPVVLPLPPPAVTMVLPLPRTQVSTLSDEERRRAVEAMKDAQNAVELYCALMVQNQDFETVRGLKQVQQKLRGAIDLLMSNDWAFLNGFIGLRIEDAYLLANGHGLGLMAEEIDGHSCTIPADDDPRRIRVEVRDGRISKVLGMG